MDDEMRAAFGRMDHYFEMLYGEVRSNREQLGSQGAELKAQGIRLDSVETELRGLRGDVEGLRNELRGFREWVVTQFAELRAELKRFGTRLDRLERQRDPLS